LAISKPIFANFNTGVCRSQNWFSPTQNRLFLITKRIFTDLWRSQNCFVVVVVVVVVVFADLQTVFPILKPGFADL